MIRSVGPLPVALALVAVLPSVVRAADGDWRRLRAGLSVEIEGEWKPARGFVAEEIDVREGAPDDGIEIRGSIGIVHAETGAIELLGVRVEVPASCRIRDEADHVVPLADLAPGTWVGVDGDFSTERLVARRIRILAEPARSLEVEGAITATDFARRRLEIGGVVVHLSHDTVVRGADLVEVPFAVDDDDVAPALIRTFDGRVRIGGRLEADVQPERNFDLNADRARDLTEANGSAELLVEARPHRLLGLLAKGSVNTTRILQDDTGGQIGASEWRLQQLFAVWRPPRARWAALQVGRQDFDEPREWLYDENLDGARLHLRRGANRAEASISTRWQTEARALDGWTNWILVLRRDVARRWTAETYAIHRRLERDPDNRPLWVGLRSEGRLTSGLRHWLELSWLDGRLDGADMHAWATDIGLRVRLHEPSRLSVTAGWALGSGGADPADGFRQTGLQDNNDKFGGVASFRYYGELLDPELANLAIATIGAGIRPLHDTSIDVVFHRYRQHHATPRLVNANLKARPDGIDPDIGTEWDLIVGFEEIPGVDLEYDVGLFDPGGAFGPGASRATFHRLSAKFYF